MLRDIEDVRRMLESGQDEYTEKCKCYHDGYQHPGGLCKGGILENLDAVQQLRKMALEITEKKQYAVSNHTIYDESKRNVSGISAKNKLGRVFSGEEARNDKEDRELLILYTYEYERRLIEYFGVRVFKTLDWVDEVNPKIHNLKHTVMK